MFSLQDVTYIHPNGDVLFSHIHFSIQKQQKIALIGHNGAGKSTLLHLLAGHLHANSGWLHTETRPYYVPQLFDRYEQMTIAQALGVSESLHALRQILDGRGTEAHLALLNDDWTLEERIHEAFDRWGLQDLDPDLGMQTLSGGQKTRVFLAGIDIHRPELVLLDEPSNHLDRQGRELLYEYINHTRHTLVVVSHDKTLLNLLPLTYELSKHGITVYGGNHDFYMEQKKTENAALEQDLKNKEKALRKAKEVERESLERQQKLDARGKQKQEKAGLPTISMKTFKNLAEKSTARSKAIHAEKTENLSQELQQLRAALPDTDAMKLDFDNSSLHRGKILFSAQGITFGYHGVPLWKEGLDFEITSGERVAIKGPNGSGKTSLLRLLMGQVEPTSGNLYHAEAKAVYMDQHYTSVDPTLSVYEQAQRYNTGALQEHEVKIRLNRFLFPKADWDKPCAALSGGEKMRLMLCCLAIGNQAPDLILLDEPSNNLDLQNLEILATAMNSYRGTLLVVCHDAYFLERIGVERSIDLA